MSTHTSVLWTTDQGLTTEQKAQARRNIDAASSADVLAAKTEVVQGTGVNVSEATGTNGQKIYTVSNAYEAPVQSDWSESDSSKQDYIKNKPSNLVQDANYVHTDNNFTTALKDKLDGIEAGAEVNVQSDWNQSNSSVDDYIKNKPANLVQDASYVHTDNNFTNTLKDKLDGIAAGAEVNVQSDWNQSNSSADDYIKNKPSNLVQDASYVHTDNNFTTTLKNKLDGIAAGAEVNVQSDWNQTDTSADDYIKNKPDINYYNYTDDASLDIDQTNRKIRVNPNLTVLGNIYPTYGSAGKYAMVASLDNLTASTINDKSVHLEIEVLDDRNTVHGKFIVDLNTDGTNRMQRAWWDNVIPMTTGSIYVKQMHLYNNGGAYQLWAELEGNIQYYKFISFKAIKNELTMNHHTSPRSTDYEIDVWKFKGYSHCVNNLPGSPWTELTTGVLGLATDNALEKLIDRKTGALDIPELVLRQHTQGGDSDYPASKLIVDQDFGEVLMNTSSEVGVGYLVPNAPSGFSSEQVLKLIPGNSNPTWSTAPKEIFPVIYGTTTISEISTALSNGKIPVLNISYGRYALMTRYSSGTAAWFTTVAMEGSLLSVAAQSYAVTSEGWSTDPRRMNGNDHYHLPNVQTAKVKVEGVDTIPTWLTIGGIMIGGMATSGGNISINLKAVTTSSGSVLSRGYIYDTLFRTNSTSDTTDNSATFGTLNINGTSWTSLYTISQYSGTHTVDCKLEVNLFDTSSDNPSHYNLKFRKLFSGNYTWMYISATYNWGDPD